MDPLLEALRRHPRAAPYAQEIVHAAGLMGVEPATLAAIVDRESLFGKALTPPGPAGQADGGHGRGLAQIDDRYHPLFATVRLGNSVRWRHSPERWPELWRDPAWSLLAAATILRGNLNLFAGDYLPAIAAYNAPEERVLLALAPLPADAPATERIRVLDQLTTGGDYVTDVLRRRDSIQRLCVPLSGSGGGVP